MGKRKEKCVRITVSTFSKNNKNTLKNQQETKKNFYICIWHQVKKKDKKEETKERHKRTTNEKEKRHKWQQQELAATGAFG